VPTTKLSVNRKALKLVDKLLANPDEYGVTVKSQAKSATLIDAGIEARSGLKAGKIITEICLGGLGNVQTCPMQVDNLVMASVFVHTNYPAIAAMGSQFADWQIKQDNFTAIGSGPARALAKKNRALYEKIGYDDKSDSTVMVLETSAEPPKAVVDEIARSCRVQASKLSLILVPTSSVAGSTQVSGRIVETGLHKLMKIGIDPKKVRNSHGSAPVAPVHPKFIVAMGRTNDAILYAGSAHYDISGYGDEELARIVEKAPSSASKSYGQPFQQIFKKANYDFYKIDPNLFAPAVVSVCNLDTGSMFQAGKTDIEVFKNSIGLKTL
jgi:methenyltetrahydromethanopterin cyclohydrolase